MYSGGRKGGFGTFLDITLVFKRWTPERQGRSFTTNGEVSFKMDISQVQRRDSHCLVCCLGL